MGSFITLLYHEIVAPGTCPTEGTAIVVQQDYQDILPPILFVDGDNFAGQMEYLVQNKWHVLNIQEVLDFYLRGQGIPEKSVLLTFDDLWSGVRDFAAPILRGLGFSALGFPVRDWLFDQITPPIPGRPTCLSKQDLKSLEDVFTWGNHGASFHTRCEGKTALETSSDEDFAKDLRAGGTLSTIPGVFAWPFGISTPRSREILAQEGYHLGFGTIPGVNNKVTEPLRLHRTVVPGNIGLDKFKTLLTP